VSSSPLVMRGCLYSVGLGGSGVAAALVRGERSFLQAQAAAMWFIWPRLQAPDPKKLTKARAVGNSSRLDSERAPEHITELQGPGIGNPVMFFRGLALVAWIEWTVWC
jgi:hypothetical protein